MISVSPPIVSTQRHGTRADGRLGTVTLHFGHRNPGPAHPILYAANPGGEPNGIDEKTGIVYPNSRLRVDGAGRTVADVRASTPPEEEWLI